MLFGSSKTKSKDLNKLFASKATPASDANAADLIMSRNTFNEKDLIKKKEEAPPQMSIIAEKEEEPQKKKKSPLD